MRGVDSVEIIEIQSREIACARGGDSVARGVHGFESRSNVGIVSSGTRFDLFGRAKCHRRVEIVGEIIVVVEIRKDQNREIQTRIEQRKLCFLKLSPAIVHLKLRLDHIGMRDFAAFLEIVRQFQKAIAFVVGFLRDIELSSRRRRHRNNSERP